MAGMIYKPNVPHPHHNLVLTNFSSHLPYLLHAEVARKVREVDATLNIDIEESSAEGRLFVAEQLMLMPLVTHWHLLRFGDITKSERNGLRDAMQAIRPQPELYVK